MGSDAPRLLGSEDVPEASSVLAAAFIGDPLWVALYPDQDRRQKTQQRFFRGLMTVAVDGGRGYGVGSPLRGIAVWRPPAPAGRPRFRSFLAFGPLLASSFPVKGVRARGVFGDFARMRRRYAPGPHAYLETVGVAADSRGRGLASGLIWPQLEAAMTSGVVVWTETVTDSNVGLYEHFGFELVEQQRDSRLGLTLYGLLRPA